MLSNPDFRGGAGPLFASALEKQSVQGLSKTGRAASGAWPASENSDQVADTTSLVSGVAERYAIAESDDLRRLVRSPVFSAEDQYRAIAAVLDKAEVGGLVANLIKVAAKNRRLFAVPDMITAFGRHLARHRGEVSAEVTSAEPLSDRHVAELKAALKASLGKDVALKAEVDPSLIGGLIVKVGSRMIDGSLKTKLNSLKLAMKEVG